MTIPTIFEISRPRADVLRGAIAEAAAIFRLDTSYGGGKTHGLIALVRAESLLSHKHHANLISICSDRSEGSD